MEFAHTYEQKIYSSIITFNNIMGHWLYYSLFYIMANSYYCYDNQCIILNHLYWSNWLSTGFRF
ncbi:hypothetical protein BLA29_014095 [Euroglyphus maynei]|uniref:Uncharacterized protein n=1 Tax=Euroglyphus maynei TaxID=6958 RepID=A0A1Y3B5S3_EURMA|nr:hypothetical protein BLA29_014095 [Euroglyphus maynei]